jgi:hypothetical protein
MNLTLGDLTTNSIMKDILKHYSSYDINRIIKPLVDGGLLEIINDTLQIGENPITTNTLPDHIQLYSIVETENLQQDIIKPYISSNQFQCDLSDIIQSNINSYLKQQPLEQIELIKKIKDNLLLSQIDSAIIIEELNKMVIEHYIKIDNAKYYKVIY